MNGYILRRSDSAIFSFADLCNRGQFFLWKEFATPGGKFFFGFFHRKVNRKFKNSSSRCKQEVLKKVVLVVQMTVKPASAHRADPHDQS